MRYSAWLSRSRRNHVLKHRRGGALIALVWFVLAFAILFTLVNVTKLDASQLYMGFLASLVRTSVAYIFALVLALIIALSITAHPLIENILLPVFDVLQSFPSFALFPVLVTALRFYPETIIITVLALEMIWPILFSVIGGIKNRRQDLEEAATIFGAKGWQRLVHFTFPQLLPSIITGSIVGWGEGWEFIIGAELLVTVHIGIGHYLGLLGDQGQNSLLAFGIVFLMFILFLINKIVWLPLLHRVTQYETEA